MTITTPQKRCYTVEEAAKVLRISEKLCYNMIKTGEIPSLHLGRVYRIPIVQLNAYLAGDLKKEVILSNQEKNESTKSDMGNHH